MSKTRVVNELHIPRAENVRLETNKRLLIDWVDKVEEAKLKGETYCYVSASGGVTRYAVQKFIDAGYDIYYSHFMHDGSWFVKVHWEDGSCGRIYNENKRHYGDIEEMFSY